MHCSESLQITTKSLLIIVLKRCLREELRPAKAKVTAAQETYLPPHITIAVRGGNEKIMSAEQNLVTLQNPMFSFVLLAAR